MTSPVDHPAPRNAWLIGVALAALVIVLYSGVLRCDFVSLDDPNHVLDNPVVKGKSLLAAFTASPGGLWIPLTWLSFKAEAALVGLTPWLFHLNNVLLHAANALLVWRWLERATGRRWPAVVVAALFAVHPLNVESVAWVTERKNVLSTFFWLLSLLAYTRFAQGGGWRNYAGALLACAAGLMAKPMVVMLPLSLLLLDVWPLQRHTKVGWRRVLADKIPFALLALVVAGITVVTVHREAGLVTAGVLPFGRRLLNAGAAYAVYLREMAWPSGLAVQSRLAEHVTVGEGIVGWAVVAVFSVGAWLWRKREPALLWGWLWFVGTLLPVIGLVQAGLQASADRFTYVPQLGIFVGVVWAAWPLAERHACVARAIGFAVIVAFAAVTTQLIPYWESSLSLFERSAVVNPRGQHAHAVAGFYNIQAGNYARAIAQCRAALELAPGDAETWNNLGIAFARTGDDKRALFAYERALAIDPSHRTAKINAQNARERLEQNR